MVRITFISFLVVLLGLTCYSQAAEHPGVKLYRDRKFAEARVVLSEAVKAADHRRNAGFWNIIGLTYAAEGKYKDARKALETAISIDPAVAAYHSNLAFVHLSLKEETRAREAAGRALALDPKDAQALSIRGSAFYRDRQYEEAERDARTLIALDETRADGYLILTQVVIGRLGRELGGKVSAEEIAAIVEAKASIEAGLKKCRGSGCNDLKDDLEGLAAWMDFAKNPANIWCPHDVMHPHRLLRLRA